MDLNCRGMSQRCSKRVQSGMLKKGVPKGVQKRGSSGEGARGGQTGVFELLLSVLLNLLSYGSPRAAA